MSVRLLTAKFHLKEALLLLFSLTDSGKGSTEVTCPCILDLEICSYYLWFIYTPFINNFSPASAYGPLQLLKSAFLCAQMKFCPFQNISFNMDITWLIPGNLCGFQLMLFFTHPHIQQTSPVQLCPCALRFFLTRAFLPEFSNIDIWLSEISLFLRLLSSEHKRLVVLQMVLFILPNDDASSPHLFNDKLSSRHLMKRADAGKLIHLALKVQQDGVPLLQPLRN